MRIRVAVVGAGVSGLSCALTILTKFPDIELTVISEAFSPNITSDVAAGMWGPFLMTGTPEQDIIKWSQVTWNQILEWHGSKGEDWGVSLVPGTCIKDTPFTPEFWRHIPIGYTSLTAEQSQHWGPQYVSGYSFTSLFSQPAKFLPKLAEEIRQMGGKFRQQRLNSLSEACNDADIVINCSGLGARTLVPDSSMFPTRGQLVRVKAPWVTSFLCDESEKTFAYILPIKDCVALGGTTDEGNWDTTEDKAVTQRILERCCKLMPSLKDAEVLGVSVGLRPGRRTGVRVEEDSVTLPHRTVPVVHNYGHGGCGVTLMFGCAQQVTDIVTNILARQAAGGDLNMTARIVPHSKM